MMDITLMSPILQNKIPNGDKWIHQLKWDGYRIAAWVDNGHVELYSKNGLLKNRNFPDLVEALSQKKGKFLLDGEAVILDANTGRPSFQLMQRRDKLADPGMIRRAAVQQPVQYIIFDLLQIGDEDLRGTAYAERYKKLNDLTSEWGAPFFPADVFEDGEALWSWVVTKGWEGIVRKRLSSLDREGKDHNDWYKRKTVLHYDVEIVGIIWKEGRVSSLVMTRNGRYFGRVSSGLNGHAKGQLQLHQADAKQEDYFSKLPDGLKGSDIRWLNIPLPARVTGLETTDVGILRHPKVTELGGIPL